MKIDVNVTHSVAFKEIPNGEGFLHSGEIAVVLGHGCY